MASAAVVAAVESRLAANWSTTAIIGENKTLETPADGSAFVTVQYPVANEQPITMGQVGQRTFRETGGFRLVLAVPRGQGVTVGLGYVETLRSLFRAQQFGGVNCLAASPAFVDNTNDDGVYFRLSFVVDYYADVFA